jgi:septal ring factor EnvC (AmiA/AmiB activator)
VNLARALAIVLLVLPGCALAAKKEEVSSDLRNLRGRIEALQKELESAKGDRNDVADELKQSEKAISDINREIRDLSLHQNEVSAKLDGIRHQSSVLEREIAGHQQSLGRLLFQQYLAGGQDAIKILLNEQDPNMVARHLRYYAYLSTARAESIKEFRDNLGRLKELGRQHKEESDKLAELRAEQEAQRKKLVASQNERKTVLAKLSKRIDAQRKEIGKLRRDEERLAKLVERLARIVPQGPRKDARSDRAGRGKPRVESVSTPSTFQLDMGRLQLPVLGELAHRFGSPREDTGLAWKGLFFRAREGQEVKAVAEGQVVFSDWLRGFGNLAIVDHGNGIMSLYGNNQTLYKRVGDSIKAGETLAAVGSSGGSMDTGLYFELRHQGKPVDPARHLGIRQ